MTTESSLSFRSMGQKIAANRSLGKISSRIFGILCKLPRAQTHDIVIDRDIAVRMPDGVDLLTDHYYPRGAGKLPTIVCRSPYGKGLIFSLQNVWAYVERGYQVVMQCCRGTYGSGGHLRMLHQEREDGLATIAWIKKQPWFNGQLATVGQSYLGYTQWAIAREAGPELKAMALEVTTSGFNKMFYMGESLALQNHIGWTCLMKDAHKSRLKFATFNNAVKRVGMHLPLSEADLVGVGETTDIWQDVVRHSEPEDYDWWKPADHSGTVCEIKVPVLLVGGWYDIFLPWMMEDYTANRNAGNKPHLVIGPWYHLSRELTAEGTRQSLAWLNAHVLGDRAGLPEKPVRLFVMGSQEWKEYSEWPPQASKPERWYLQPGGALATEAPSRSDPDRYRYDPADPTPNRAGPLMASDWGSKDNRALEARPDVLVYTSKPLSKDFEIIGPVQAELYIKSSLEHTNFFVRVCDVKPSGKSLNILRWPAAFAAAAKVDGEGRMCQGSPRSLANGVLFPCRSSHESSSLKWSPSALCA